MTYPTYWFVAYAWQDKKTGIGLEGNHIIVQQGLDFNIASATKFLSALVGSTAIIQNWIRTTMEQYSEFAKLTEEFNARNAPPKPKEAVILKMVKSEEGKLDEPKDSLPTS